MKSHLRSQKSNKSGQTSITGLLYHKSTISTTCSTKKSKFNKKDTLSLPAKKHDDCQQYNHKGKQLHVIFFCTGNKSFKLFAHGARPFRHCRNPFYVIEL